MILRFLRLILCGVWSGISHPGVRHRLMLEDAWVDDMTSSHPLQVLSLCCSQDWAEHAASRLRDRRLRLASDSSLKYEFGLHQSCKTQARVGCEKEVRDFEDPSYPLYAKACGYSVTPTHYPVASPSASAKSARPPTSPATTSDNPSPTPPQQSHSDSLGPLCPAVPVQSCSASY